MELRAIEQTIATSRLKHLLLKLRSCTCPIRKNGSTSLPSIRSTNSLRVEIEVAKFTFGVSERKNLTFHPKTGFCFVYCYSSSIIIIMNSTIESRIRFVPICQISPDTIPIRRFVSIRYAAGVVGTVISYRQFEFSNFNFVVSTVSE